MNGYLAVKLVHVLGATILFGTGIGTAWFMLRAWRSGDAAAFRHTARAVVMADWLFTAPAVVVQFVSGLWLAGRLGIPADSAWLVTVVALYAVVGCCWLPVVWIQLRVRDRLRAGAEPGACAPLMRWWVALGIPAFAIVVVLFVLMIYRPGLHTSIGLNP